MRNGVINITLVLMAILLCFAVGEVTMRAFDLDRQLAYEVDPKLYWTMRANQVGFMWMGSGGTLRSPDARINALGLRGPDTTPGHADRVRILTLGDSYTFGSGVRDEETFSAVLEGKLGASRVEVVNGGAPGYGIFQMQRLLQRLMPMLHPDVVVVTIPTGDITRQPFATDEEESRYLQNETRKKTLRKLGRFATFVYQRIWYVKTRYFSNARAVPNEATGVDDERFARLWNLDLQRLGEMAELCKQSGATMVVMPWPQGRKETWDQMLASGVEQLARQTHILGLTGLAEVLGRHPRTSLIIPGDGHPSAAAHSLAATYLGEALEPILRGREAGTSTVRRPGRAVAMQARLLRSNSRHGDELVTWSAPTTGVA